MANVSFGVIDCPLRGYDGNWSDLTHRVQNARIIDKKLYKEVLNNDDEKINEKPTPKIIPDAFRNSNNKDVAKPVPTKWTDGSNKENTTEKSVTMNKINSKYVSPQRICSKCLEPVYQQELVEPKVGLLYHSWCFKCCVCGTKLQISTFHTNQQDMEDIGVYCKGHTPTTRVSIDADGFQVQNQHRPKSGQRTSPELRSPPKTVSTLTIN